MARAARRGAREARRYGPGEWIDLRVLPAFAGRILAIDVPITLCRARLHAPDPRAERDALIAATAIVHRMTVVTRNVGDLEPMGVRTLNPWGTG